MKRVLTLLVLVPLLIVSLAGCRWGGGSESPPPEESPAITSDQAGLIGNASIDVTMDVLNSVLGGDGGALSLSRMTPALAITPDITITSATTCDEVSVTSCEAPSSTSEVTINGDSGSCSGTIAVCDGDRIATLTCTDYLSNGVVLNGQIVISMSGVADCNINSVISADLQSTIDGNTCPVSLSFSSTGGSGLLTMTGCMTACGSGFNMSTTVPFTTQCTPNNGGGEELSKEQLFDIYNGPCDGPEWEPFGDQSNAYDIWAMLEGNNADLFVCMMREYHRNYPKDLPYQDPAANRCVGPQICQLPNLLTSCPETAGLCDDGGGGGGGGEGDGGGGVEYCHNNVAGEGCAALNEGDCSNSYVIEDTSYNCAWSNDSGSCSRSNQYCNTGGGGGGG